MEPTEQANLDPKDYVRVIASGICTFPDRIEIQESMDQRGVLIELFVDKEDLGRMIGKGGETASAIRQLMRALGSKNNAHYGFKVNARAVTYSTG